MKIYNTKLSHCRPIPRKNAAINLKCHRRHFLFEITRNIGPKYSLAVCLQWKLSSKFSKKTKKNFRTIVITKWSIFIVNHLSRLLVCLKLGLQIPKNPRHCKRHNWGPAHFKPLPQYSHNSAPSVDYPSWTQLQVLSQASPHVDIYSLYRGIFYDCSSGLCSRISLNRGSVRYILL